jgi:hypothetical protein
VVPAAAAAAVVTQSANTNGWRTTTLLHGHRLAPTRSCLYQVTGFDLLWVLDDSTGTVSKTTILYFYIDNRQQHESTIPSDSIYSQAILLIIIVIIIAVDWAHHS